MRLNLLRCHFRCTALSDGGEPQADAGDWSDRRETPILDFATTPRQATKEE